MRVRLTPYLTLMTWACLSVTGVPVGLGDQPARADDRPSPAGALAVAIQERSAPPVYENNSVYVSDSNSQVQLRIVRMDGSLAAADDDHEVFLVTPGGLASRLSADRSGLLTFRATSGLHAIVAIGSGGHAAIPLLVRKRWDLDAAPTTPTDPIVLPVFNLDREEIYRVTQSFLSPQSDDAADDDFDHAALAEGETLPAHRYLTQLGPDGELRGRVMSLDTAGTVAGNNVLVYRRGTLVARAISGIDGEFTVGELVPGNYGLICVGPGGYAAFAFEAVPGDEVASEGSATSFVSTSLMQAGGDGLPVVMVPPALVPEALSIPPPDDPEAASDTPVAAAPAMAGAGGAGGGFGGGAGGGSAGIGGAGLIGLAGLGAAAAAAASGSSDRVVVPPLPEPATPSVPASSDN